MGPWEVLKEAGKGDCRVGMGIVFLCPASHPLYGCPDAEAQQTRQGSLQGGGGRTPQGCFLESRWQWTG